MTNGRCVGQFPDNVVGQQSLPSTVILDERLDVLLQEIGGDGHRGSSFIAGEMTPSLPSPAAGAMCFLLTRRPVRVKNHARIPVFLIARSMGDRRALEHTLCGLSARRG